MTEHALALLRYLPDCLAELTASVLENMLNTDGGKQRHKTADRVTFAWTAAPRCRSLCISAYTAGIAFYHMCTVLHASPAC